MEKGNAKFSKYYPCLAVTVSNSFLLTLFLVAGIDKFEKVFNRNVLISGFFQICVCSLIVLLFCGIMTPHFQKLNLKQTVRRLTFITLLISFYLYSVYTVTIVCNRFSKASLRASVMDKVIVPPEWYYGSKGADLSIAEYREISRTAGFQPLPNSASNISYEYNKVEFLLPDFSFLLQYEIPINIKVETFKSEKNGSYVEYRDFTDVNGIRTVTYSLNVY